ncbi:MAG: helix-turn-helix domain-containing protein [Clostridia bacterium]
MDKFIKIPQEIARDKELKASAKLLFGEILGLTKATGECYASNKYLAKICNLTPVTISNLIKNLKEKEYIFIDNSSDLDDNMHGRTIKIFLNNDKKMDNTPYKISNKGGIKENFKQNSIINKRVIINSTSTPTRTEIEDFILQNNLNVNPDKFFNYYDKKNFLFQDKIINWRERAFEWHKYEKSNFVKTPKLYDKPENELAAWELEMLKDMEKACV